MFSIKNKTPSQLEAYIVSRTEGSTSRLDSSQHLRSVFKALVGGRGRARASLGGVGVEY